jgi:hypothetical protein
MPVPITITRGVPGGSGFFAGIGVAPANLSPPTAAEVQITSDDGTMVVRARLDEPPTTVGGGGIEPVTRPQRRPLTPYRTPEAPGLTLSLLLDGWSDGRSVEADCRTLERMASMFLPSDPGPSKLIVVGEAVPHCSITEAVRHRWLISDPPAWGEALRDSTGARLRQQVTLTLLLSTEAEELEQIKPRQPKPNYKVAVAHQGDTYLKIAARRLGSQRLGRKLAQLNDERDPTKTIPTGHKVRLPSDHLLGTWRKALGIGG